MLVKFEWLFGKRKIVEKDKRNMFFEHDLNEWNYLGRTSISYTRDGMIDSSTDIFFFCAKDDTNVRSYHVVKEKMFETHDWITRLAEPWRVGFKDLYSVIFDEPSPFLEEYMLRNHKHKWDNESNCWKISDTSKYEAAQKEQSEKKKVVTVTENVLKFPKKTS